MGVPKFFRYMSERYPCLSELIKEYQIPEFDNLYLDMNGIIHVCSHPNDNDPHFRITEEKIFNDIFRYIEVLFRLIQPQKLFFMAVDGVAPRAKMNHQRSRRFRSAKDAENQAKEAERKGETLPDEKRFDSNCITPGTDFMVRLQEALRKFVSRKMSADKLWKKPKIILSGHQVPGEGEHKIMDYIRFMKSQPDYNPNTRHCVYGLDADLIMLGLCTHEPFFSLLREEVKFGKQNSSRCLSAEESNFYLLHLSIMRDYLDLEFQALKKKLPFKYDLECIINDWVLMGFLVGNDFIPHLPNFHIANGTLPILYNAYMDVLPSLDGYINEEGTLNLKRFEAFLKKLAEYDQDNFREKSADLKYWRSKTKRNLEENELDDDFDDSDNSDESSLDDDDDDQLEFSNPELAALVKKTDELIIDEEVDENALFTQEFKNDRKDYYKTKMEIDMNSESISHQAKTYVEAIQWNLYYYYDGCCSWSWFYPFHYAPYVSDIQGFSNFKFDFKVGKPFLPFQQLLAVLPPASKELLPVPYQKLMTEENSPIYFFYPTEFKTDLNGKKQEWEAVVLLPFIDEKSLLSAMRMRENELTEQERLKNSHGPMHIYTSCDSASSQKTTVKIEAVPREALIVEKSKLVKGLCKGVNLDSFAFGFPRLLGISFEAHLEKAKVHIFESACRNESMILNISASPPSSLAEISSKLLNKNVLVNWPFLVEARVTQVSDLTEKHYLGSNGKVLVEKMNKSALEAWHSCNNLITSRYLDKKGVNVGDTHVIIFAHPVIGQKYLYTKDDMVTSEKEYAPNGSYYVLQGIILDLPAQATGMTHLRTLAEVFPPKSLCFMLGHPHYGCLGKVLASTKSNRIKIEVEVLDDPDLENVKRNLNNIKKSYMKGHVAAARLGISSHLLSRITGTILVLNPSEEDDDDGSLKSSSNLKINIGLNLKLTKKNEMVPGYTKKEGNMWLYSQKAINLVISYIENFPYIFEHLNKSAGDDTYKADDLFPAAENKKEALKSLMEWLKKEPFYSVPRVSCSTEILETETMKEILTTVDQFYSSLPKQKKVVLEVKPHLLYQPVCKLDVKLPDPSTEYFLLDRVICIRESFAVPLGFKGTVVGIELVKREADEKNDNLVTVLFDKDFKDEDSKEPWSKRLYRLHAQALINISHGLRKTTKTSFSKPINSTKPVQEGVDAPSWRIDNKQINPSAFATVESSSSPKYHQTSGSHREEMYQRFSPKKDFSRPNSYYPGSHVNSALPFSNEQPTTVYAPESHKIGQKMSTNFNQNPNESDYKTMWQELKNAGNSKSSAPPPVDSSTSALKKMLKIADASRSNISLRPSSNFSSSTSYMVDRNEKPPLNYPPNISFQTPYVPPNLNPNFSNVMQHSFRPPINNFTHSNGLAKSTFSSLPPPPIVHLPLVPPMPMQNIMAPIEANHSRVHHSQVPDKKQPRAANNPFIPLQVTRNQVSNTSNQSNSVLPFSKPNFEQISQPKNEATASTFQTSNSSPALPVSKRGKKKSRIAAKFFNPPQ